MKTYLCAHPLLKMSYLEEKGITKAISDLAADRFADSTKVELGIKMGTMQIILDLRAGEDGFSGKPVPNLGKLALDDIIWTQISMATEAALLDCAKTTKQ